MPLQYVSQDPWGGAIAGALSSGAAAARGHLALEPLRKDQANAQAQYELLEEMFGAPEQAVAPTEGAPPQQQEQWRPPMLPPEEGSAEDALGGIASASKLPEIDGPVMSPQELAHHKKVMSRLSGDAAREYRIALTGTMQERALQEASAAAAAEWQRAIQLGDLGDAGNEQAKFWIEALESGAADPFAAHEALQEQRRQAAAMQALQETKLTTLSFVTSMRDQLMESGAANPETVTRLNYLVSAVQSGLVKPDEAYRASIMARFGLKEKDSTDLSSLRARFISDWMKNRNPWDQDTAKMPSEQEIQEYLRMVTGQGSQQGVWQVPGTGEQQPDANASTEGRDWQAWADKLSARGDDKGAAEPPPRNGSERRPTSDAPAIDSGQEEAIVEELVAGKSFTEAVTAVVGDPSSVSISEEQGRRIKAAASQKKHHTGHVRGRMRDRSWKPQSDHWRDGE